MGVLLGKVGAHTHATVIGGKLRAVTLAGVIALCIGVTVLYEAGALQQLLRIETIRALFQSIVWEAFPFIVLGAVVSAMMESFIRGDAMAHMLPDSLGGRAVASLLGVVLPVCDCGAVSVARTLRRKGVGESIAFSYALSTPTLNLVALYATYAAFHQQWTWVILRGGAALAIAMVAGLVVRVREEALTEQWTSDYSVGPSPARKGWALFRHATDHAGAEIFAVGPFFILSALMAAVAQSLWPIHSITMFTQHSLWSIVLLMALGSVLSLCSEADAFVAASLSTLFSPGAILAFLLMGQMVDLRNLLLMPRVFSRRTVVAGLAVATILTFVFALAVNRYLVGGWV